MRPRNYQYKGYTQQDVDAATAETLANIPAGSRYVSIIPSTAIRWRADGTDPTASVGTPVQTNGELFYDGERLAALEVISQSGTATLDCTFYA